MIPFRTFTREIMIRLNNTKQRTFKCVLYICLYGVSCYIS